MIANHWVSRALGILTCVALSLIAAPNTSAQQRTSTTTKKPAPPPTTVTPTASEGTTATAIRGRPANPAAAKAVNAALKTALSKPAVQSALRAEVLRQLRVNRPIALVAGSWVTVINVALLAIAF